MNAATFPVVFRLFAPIRTTQPGANDLGSLLPKSCRTAPSCTEKVSVKDVELSPVSVAGDVAEGSFGDSFIANCNGGSASVFMIEVKALPELDHERRSAPKRHPQVAT